MALSAGALAALTSLSGGAQIAQQGLPRNRGPPRGGPRWARPSRPSRRPRPADDSSVIGHLQLDHPQTECQTGLAQWRVLIICVPQRIGKRDDLVGRTSAGALGRTDFRADGQPEGCHGAIMATVVEHTDRDIFAHVSLGSTRANPGAARRVRVGPGSGRAGFGSPTQGCFVPGPSYLGSPKCPGDPVASEPTTTPPRSLSVSTPAVSFDRSWPLSR